MSTIPQYKDFVEIEVGLNSRFSPIADYMGPKIGEGADRILNRAVMGLNHDPYELTLYCI